MRTPVDFEDQIQSRDMIHLNFRGGGQHSTYQGFDLLEILRHVKLSLTPIGVHVSDLAEYELFRQRAVMFSITPWMSELSTEELNRAEEEDLSRGFGTPEEIARTLAYLARLFNISLGTCLLLRIPQTDCLADVN